MKKLLVRILFGLVIFIGGQWIGLEVQSRKFKGSDASAPIQAPNEAPASAPKEPSKN